MMSMCYKALASNILIFVGLLKHRWFVILLGESLQLEMSSDL